MLFMAERDERKKLHNELMDLKGQVRVYCRARPFISKKMDIDSAQVVVGFPDPYTVRFVDSTSKEQKKF